LSFKLETGHSWLSIKAVNPPLLTQGINQKLKVGTVHYAYDKKRKLSCAPNPWQENRTLNSAANPWQIQNKGC
jgi:hypothetical protein